MRAPDINKERSERKLSLADFLESYNDGLPSGFARATLATLKEFQKTHPGMFTDDNTWSLGQHRKKFMDWLPQRTDLLI